MHELGIILINLTILMNPHNQMESIKASFDFILIYFDRILPSNLWG